MRDPDPSLPGQESAPRHDFRELHSALTTETPHIDLVAEAGSLRAVFRRAVIAVLGIMLALLVALIAWQAVAAQLHGLRLYQGVERHG